MPLANNLHNTTRTGLPRSHKQISLCDERPAGAETQQSDALITQACSKEVTNPVVLTVVGDANDRNGHE